MAAPASVGLPATLTENLDNALREAIEKGATPGAEGLLLVDHKEVYHNAFGLKERVPQEIPLRKDALFDLASLTKVLVTTPLAMKQVEAGKIGLDDPIRNVFPEYTGGGKERVTLRHLLTHTSGIGNLPKAYLLLSGKEAYLQAILDWPLQNNPGEERIYSDFGMMLVGFLIEKLAGESLDQLAQEEIFEPLGMTRTTFNPPLAWRWRCVPTEICPWRQSLIQGVVHDENAYAMGGVSGHAGLFSTGDDLAVFAQMMLNRGSWDGHTIFKPETVDLMLADEQVPDATFQRLGWQVVEEIGQQTGWLLSARTYGHTGFTGASLWIDPDNETAAILFSNAVHPKREDANRTLLRKGFHEVIVEALKTRKR